MIVLTFTSEIPIDYEYLEIKGVGHILFRIGEVDLLCNSHGYMIIEKDEGEGFVEYIAPLLTDSGFNKNSLIMYYISKLGHLKKIKGFELKHLLLDSETLNPLQLNTVLPEKTTIANNGGGAIGYHDYMLLSSFRGERYLHQVIIPQIIRKVLVKVYGKEPKEWKGRIISPLSKPALTVDINGYEYLVLHMLVERPIREHLLERGLQELIKLLKKLRISRGILLMLYVERITISGFRTYTPRLFWYLLSYDKEKGHLAVPGVV